MGFYIGFPEIIVTFSDILLRYSPVDFQNQILA